MTFQEQITALKEKVKAKIKPESSEDEIQEINGLLDHEHNPKFDIEEIKDILWYKHNLGFVFK